MSIIHWILLIIVILFIVNYIASETNIKLLNKPNKNNIHEDSILEQHYYQNFLNLETSSKKKYLFIFHMKKMSAIGMIFMQEVLKN